MGLISRVSSRTYRNKKMVTKQEVEQLIKDHLEPSHLDVYENPNMCDTAFECIIVSSKFEGVSRINRHKMVNEAVASVMPQIHAFSQKPFTPKQWEDKKAKEATT